MAKEIIDAVKAAELKSAEDISQAKADAASMVKAVKDAAKKEHDELLKKASEEASAAIKKAEEEAGRIVAEACAVAAEEAEALRASVMNREDAAVKAVISSLLDN